MTLTIGELLQCSIKLLRAMHSFVIKELFVLKRWTEYL